MWCIFVFFSIIFVHCYGSTAQSVSFEAECGFVTPKSHVAEECELQLIPHSIDNLHLKLDNIDISESLFKPNLDVCNLNSIDRRTLGFPDDLFKTLRLDPLWPVPKFDSSWSCWASFFEAFDRLRSCPAALSEVESLSIHICSHWIQRYIPMGAIDECVPPPTHVVDFFADALAGMKNLNSLRIANQYESFWHPWTLSSKVWQSWASAFERRGGLLERVAELDIGHGWEWLLWKTPNVVKLSALATGLDPALQLPNVTEFHGRHSWLPEDLRAMHPTLPNIKNLSILRLNFGPRTPRVVEHDHACHLQIESYPESYPSRNSECLVYHDDDELRDYVAELTRFKSLEHLALPAVEDLHMYGHKYEGCEGDDNRFPLTLSDVGDLTRARRRLHAHASEEAYRIVAQGLPNLRTLRIGGNEFRIRRTDGTLAEPT